MDRLRRARRCHGMRNRIQRRRQAVPHRSRRFRRRAADDRLSGGNRALLPGLRISTRGTPPGCERRGRERRSRSSSLHPAVVNRFQEKAAFSAATEYLRLWPPRPCRRRMPSAKSDVIDLTSRMKADGMLDWTPPAGPLGGAAHRLFAARDIKTRRPRPKRPAWRSTSSIRRTSKAYFDNYLDQYKEATGGLMGKRGLAVRDHRQLGGRTRQLDRRHDGGVRQAARLRYAAVASGSHRPDRGKRRSYGPLPLGLPQDTLRNGRRSITTIS